MTRDEALFHIAFIKEGGLLSVTVPVAPKWIIIIKKDYETYISRIQRQYKLMPMVYLDFINNPHINAHVKKLEDKYLVGINMGTYGIIDNMFGNIFASQNLVTGIGNPKGEQPGRHILDISQSDRGLHINIPSQLHKPDVRDPERFKYYRAYVRFAFEFLIAHEYAHVHNGHVGYIASLSGDMYSEQYCNQNIIKKVGPVNYQAMEMDADRVAGFRAYYDAETYLSLYQAGKESFELFKSWRSFIYHWSFAIYCLFRVFTPKLSFKNLDIRLDPHPSPSMRMQFLGIQLLNLIAGKDREELITLIEIVDKASKDAENVLQQVLPPEIADSLPLDIWGEEGKRNYLMELIAVLHELEPAIESYSYTLKR